MPRPPLTTWQTDLPALAYHPHMKATGMITVRIPPSLHSKLLDEANRCHTSLNLLCVSKLIAAIDGCPIVPAGNRRDQAAFAAWRDAEFPSAAEKETR